MSTTTIRRCEPRDLLRVATLAGKLVRLHHSLDARRFFLPADVEAGYEWWFTRELGRAEVVLLVAEDARDQTIVGYVYGRLEERDWNQLLDACGALHDIWVEPEARQHGVAKQLANAAITELHQKGAPRVVLHTAAENEAAQRLFTSLGFRRTMIEMTREASPHE